jgi:membrane protease subunit HflC
MKRNPVTLITAGVLLLIFVFMLFTFQVRQTQVAVVTTFGKYSRSITEPGWKGRLPWPIQKVYEFDNRLQSFEGKSDKLDQTITRDQVNLLILVYVGWRIADPKLFLESLNGDPARAAQTLEPLVRNAKTGVIGHYAFSELISTNVSQLKFDEIEREILKAVQARARNTYGIQVEHLGIKQLNLPESITSTVFERMRAERQRLVEFHQADGDRRAKEIRAAADVAANEILYKAKAEAIRISGQADNKAAEYYAVFGKNRELAIFLFQLKALIESLKEKTSLILDQQTPPFNLLNGVESGGSSAPAKK